VWGLVVLRVDSVGGRSLDIVGKLAGCLASWVVCDSVRGFVSIKDATEGSVLWGIVMAVVVARLMIKDFGMFFSPLKGRSCTSLVVVFDPVRSENLLWNRFWVVL
jgi:hypothetical protein